MRRSLSHYATLLALCAMLLRGVIPLGWMPSADGDFMALCTATGLVQVAVSGDLTLLDTPAPHAPDAAQHTLCPFAAAGPLGSAQASHAFAAVPPTTGLPVPAYASPLLDHRPAGNTLARAPPTRLNRA